MSKVTVDTEDLERLLSSIRGVQYASSGEQNARARESKHAKEWARFRKTAVRHAEDAAAKMGLNIDADPSSTHFIIEERNTSE